MICLFGVDSGGRVLLEDGLKDLDQRAKAEEVAVIGTVRVFQAAGVCKVDHALKKKKEEKHEKKQCHFYFYHVDVVDKVSVLVRIVQQEERAPIEPVLKKKKDEEENYLFYFTFKKKCCRYLWDGLDDLVQLAESLDKRGDEMGSDLAAVGQKLADGIAEGGRREGATKVLVAIDVFLRCLAEDLHAAHAHAHRRGSRLGALGLHTRLLLGCGK